MDINVLRGCPFTFADGFNRNPSSSAGSDPNLSIIWMATNPKPNPNPNPIAIILILIPNPNPNPQLTHAGPRQP